MLIEKGSKVNTAGIGCHFTGLSCIWLFIKVSTNRSQSLLSLGIFFFLRLCNERLPCGLNLINVTFYTANITIHVLNTFLSSSL